MAEADGSEPKPIVDLLVRCGQLVCPTSGLSGPGAVAVGGGRILAAGADVNPPSRRTIDAPQAILLPGLIDLHAHPACTGSVFGGDPDRYMLPRGVTTVLSQGDAGADNWREFVETTILSSRTRVILALNLARCGESTGQGCFSRIDSADVDACVAAAAACGEHIWGLAVNASTNACGRTDPREVLRRGVAAAERTGLPLLYGMRRPEEWPFAEQLRWLRPGDVVTYCFRRQPHCIVEQGRVHPAIRAAAGRGVLFDVGHGMASFDWEVAEAAIADGFFPQTISTDWQRKHAALTPTHDLPLTMSKLRAAGMPEREIYAAVTARPAAVLRRSTTVGSLSPGACADLTLLEWDATPAPLFDCRGAERRGGRWCPLVTIRAGEVVAPVGMGGTSVPENL